MTECAHCGRDPAAGYARGWNGERLCHPDDPALPDCYRRVTIWHEQLGKLRGHEPQPAGVEGISPEDDAFIALVRLSEELGC